MLKTINLSDGSSDYHDFQSLTDMKQDRSWSARYLVMIISLGCNFLYLDIIGLLDKPT
jgi:hypothetical protein